MKDFTTWMEELNDGELTIMYDFDIDTLPATLIVSANGKRRTITNDEPDDYAVQLTEKLLADLAGRPIEIVNKNELYEALARHLANERPQNATLRIDGDSAVFVRP